MSEAKRLSATRPETDEEVLQWKNEIKTSIYQSASQRLKNTCIVKLCGNHCYGEENDDMERKVGISENTGGVCMECYKHNFSEMIKATKLEDQFKKNPFNIILSHTNHYCSSLAKHISDSVDEDRFSIEKEGEDNLKISLEPAESKEETIELDLTTK